jgi:DNA-binding NarL/FixJ family response regulator
MHPRFSPTERQVIRLVGRGYTNKKIATELDLTDRTVRTVVSGILKKTDRENRTQLALYAIENHFVPTPLGDPTKWL